MIAIGSEFTPLTGLVATVYAFHEATLTNEEKANYCLKESNTYWNRHKVSGNAVDMELAESFHRLYFKYSGIDMNNRKFVLKQGRW